ncbi:hypothetical protein V8E36_008264 [Tilletia maclaganii]
MAQFTPNTSFASAPESDYAYLLGGLAWTDHIVFTKESLLDFLKTKDIQVSQNFKEIQQLPKFATVGKFDRDPASASGASGAQQQQQQVQQPQRAQQAAPQGRAGIQALPGVVDASGKPYRPNYKVTEPMGGGSAAVSALFAPLDEDEAPRPPRRAPAPPTAAAETGAYGAPEQQQQQPQQQQRSVSGNGYVDDGSYRPTTRVTMPGGTGGQSSITLG